MADCGALQLGVLSFTARTSQLSGAGGESVSAGPRREGRRKWSRHGNRMGSSFRVDAFHSFVDGHILAMQLRLMCERVSHTPQTMSERTGASGARGQTRRSIMDPTEHQLESWPLFSDSTRRVRWRRKRVQALCSWSPSEASFCVVCVSDATRSCRQAVRVSGRRPGIACRCCWYCARSLPSPSTRRRCHPALELD